MNPSIGRALPLAVRRGARPFALLAHSGGACLSADGSSADHDGGLGGARAATGIGGEQVKHVSPPSPPSLLPPNVPNLREFLQQRESRKHQDHAAQPGETLETLGRTQRGSIRIHASGLSHGLAHSHGPGQAPARLDPTVSTATAMADVPFIASQQVSGLGRKVFFETYGCQMNVNDTEIVWAVLKGVGYERTEVLEEADVILLMTCAIRENAEKKIWNRLASFNALQRRRRKGDFPLKVGVLGCMAERLKTKFLETERVVDIVAGPDAYRDLPRLLSIAEGGQKAINVQLSLDETYADIAPVRLSKDSVSAFVSIMRGCDNMCSFCIVPFTRGRERSRSIASIVGEVRQLSEQGINEVTLLGQNVNSYRDDSAPAAFYPGVQVSSGQPSEESVAPPVPNTKGFKTIYKPKSGGVLFAELLRQVAAVNPNMRIRFTSPHPKDFPDEVLQIIRDTPNVCKSLHMPAQSGSTAVLERMRRGYTKEAFLELAGRVREIIPGVTLSTDLISGFCGETEQDHLDTLDLLEKVKFENAYMYAYSMREKTHAHRKLTDDVPQDVKLRRLNEVIDTFHKNALLSLRRFVGGKQVVLVEGMSRRSEEHLMGRTDGNVQTIIAARPFKDMPPVLDEQLTQQRQDLVNSLRPGDFVEVEVVSTTSHTMKCHPVRRVSSL